MKALDRFLQRWRIAKVIPFIPAGARVLDIGCGDGALFERLGARMGAGIGVDPTLSAARTTDRYRLVPGSFPSALSDTEPFDAITLLAVLEHIPPSRQKTLATDCAQRLKAGGLLLISVPSHHVDRILTVLTFLRLLDGMSLEEHYGFDPRQTPAIFAVPGLRLVKATRFQLGLNNLFVFAKT